MLSNHSTIVLKRVGPLWENSQYRDTKDPCPVFDGNLWHIYGSGGAVIGDKQEEWEILHATSPTVTGLWAEQPSVVLVGLSGKHVAAPGVVYERGVFHMLVQTEFLDVGGTIEYLTSTDGTTFTRQTTALHSIEGTSEAALYDPHQAIVDGKKYLTYSGSDIIKKQEGSWGKGIDPWVGRPDIYLAISESNTWAGPWKRLGKILDHENVIHHNQRDHTSYEWGLEGSQLMQMPNGIVVMNTVCFLPHGEYGTRQRIFFSFAERIEGPYFTAGTVLQPRADSWESGENGHAAAHVYGPDMVMFYQARPPGLQPWRYGIAYFDVRTLERVGKSTLEYHRQLARLAKPDAPRELHKLTDKLRHSKHMITLTQYSRELRAALRKPIRISRRPH